MQFQNIKKIGIQEIHMQGLNFSASIPDYAILMYGGIWKIPYSPLLAPHPCKCRTPPPPHQGQSIEMILL